MIDQFEDRYRFLSNFYICAVEYKGVVFRSSEHAYQAQKAARPDDFWAIVRAETPARAKQLGSSQFIQLRNDWDAIRLTVMEEVTRAKFTQHEELAKWLLATGDEELVEGNWWGDTFWGTVEGKGENHLGKILMKVREELRK